MTRAPRAQQAPPPSRALATETGSSVSARHIMCTQSVRGGGCALVLHRAAASLPARPKQPTHTRASPRCRHGRRYGGACPLSPSYRVTRNALLQLRVQAPHLLANSTELRLRGHPPPAAPMTRTHAKASRRVPEAPATPSATPLRAARWPRGPRRTPRALCSASSARAPATQRVSKGTPHERRGRTLVAAAAACRSAASAARRRDHSSARARRTLRWRTLRAAVSATRRRAQRAARALVQRTSAAAAACPK